MKQCVLFFWSKIAIYLSLGFHKERPSYRRSLHHSKENIQHFKIRNFLSFFLFLWVIFALLDPDQVPNPDPLTWFNPAPDPDSKHWIRCIIINRIILLFGECRFQRKVRQNFEAVVLSKYSASKFFQKQNCRSIKIFRIKRLKTCLIFINISTVNKCKRGIFFYIYFLLQ